MMESLLAEMKAEQEQMGADMKTNQKVMKAKKDINKQKTEANLEEMRATVSGYREAIEAVREKMKACREAKHASLEKTDTTTKAGQEQMRVEIKTDLEKNEGHNECQPRKYGGQSRKERGHSRALQRGTARRATHLLAAPQSRVCDVLHQAPKRVTYMTTEDRFGDQKLVAPCRT
jgi:hypothetical protein